MAEKTISVDFLIGKIKDQIKWTEAEGKDEVLQWSIDRVRYQNEANYAIIHFLERYKETS